LYLRLLDHDRYVVTLNQEFDDDWSSRLDIQ
jgi:hypothetical protein